MNNFSNMSIGFKVNFTDSSKILNVAFPFFKDKYVGINTQLDIPADKIDVQINFIIFFKLNDFSKIVIYKKYNIKKIHII